MCQPDKNHPSWAACGLLPSNGNYIVPPNELEAGEAIDLSEETILSLPSTWEFTVSQIMHTPSSRKQPAAAIDHVLRDHNDTIISLRVNLQF